MTRLLTGATLLACLLQPLDAAAQGPDRWTGRDKLLHVTVAAGLASGAYAGTALLTGTRRPRLAAGLTVGIGASAWKEWRDRHTGGDPSWKDFTAGVVGSIAGTTLAWLIDRGVSRQPASAPAAGRQ